MKMKDFKAALESKLRYAEKNLKVEEDILVFINSDKEERLENDNT